MRPFLLLVLAAVWLGCGGSDDPDPKGGLGQGGSGVIKACDDPQTFRCTTSCDEGTISDPVCANGKWGCVAGTTATSICEARCRGTKAPADRCGADGWVCEAERADIERACPAQLCSTCEGFDGPLSDGFCTCECRSGKVACYLENIEEA